MSSSVYLICGNDEYLVSQKAKDLVKSLVDPNNPDFGLDVVEANVTNADGVQDAVNRCIGALREIGLFGGRKVVWLQNATFFGDSQAGKSELAKQKVEELTEVIKSGLADDVFLVVTAEKADKRRAFYKACDSAGEVHEFVISDKAYQSEKDAKARIMQAMKSSRLKMNDMAVEAFLNKVGTDTRQIFNEMDKLSVYVGQGNEATAMDVNDICSSSRTAIGWDFSDAVGSRNLAKSLKILRQLLFQGESYMMLITMLQSRVRDLIIYREALDQRWLRSSGSGYRAQVKWGDVSPSAESVFEDCFARDPRKTHPFRVKVLAGQASKFTMKELIRMQELITQTQESMVSSAVPPSTRLELLLSSMMKGQGAKG
ncbi:DNA polymerase III subunit delta [bacterium B17]|nr:DNA polymerase III subunit delta [bacterium B17]